MKYPKIETLYVRSKTDWKVLTDQIRCPEFELVRWWLVTDKIDGTNVRVILTPDGDVEIRGRTDKAQFNPEVLQTLQDMFPADRVQSAFEQEDEGKWGLWPTVVLYGEGYGEKIQKGGKYRKRQSFRLFDVRVGDWWLNWDDVCDVANKLEIKTVPVVTLLTVPLTNWDGDITRFLQSSEVAWQDSKYDCIDAEGIVARTDPLLFTRRGDRVMWKLKFKDFG